MKRQDGVKESSQARRYELMLEALKEVKRWDENHENFPSPGLPYELLSKVDLAISEGSKTGASE